MELLIIIGIVWIGILIWKNTQARSAEQEVPIKLVITTEYHSNNDSASYDDNALQTGADAWEPFDYQSARDVGATGQYRIDYRDTHGTDSTRNINIRRLTVNNSDSMISAFCELRQANRSFLNSRVVNAIDLDTGEVVGNLADHAIAKYQATPAGQIDALFTREEEALAVLLFVAKADGKMLKAERKLIADYLLHDHPDISIDPIELDNGIKKLWIPDSIKEFKHQAEALAKSDPDRYHRINSAAVAIVATQKTIDPIERAALDILAKIAVSSRTAEPKAINV